MLYFKILMMAVATLSALSVFADGDKSQRGRYAGLFLSTSALFLLAVVVEKAFLSLL